MTRKIKIIKSTKIFFSLFQLIFVFGFFGCSTTDNQSFSCPYIISNPHVELGKKSNVHEFAGTYFTFYNDSDKTVTEYTVSFLLYDDEGKNPFIGSNCVVEKIAMEQKPHEAREAIVNLDSYLSVVPDEPYVIDFMYIREIRYSDGSSWSDPWGMYAVKEVYE